MSGFQQIEVEPGVRLAVDVPPQSGAPVVMLSNSIGANFGMWDETVSRLSGRARIIRYDTRGHGRSDAPKGPYTLEQLGSDAVAILDTLEIRRVIFCGLSLGGLTGMWIGAAHPERLNGLILANTAASFPPASMWHDRAAMVRANGLAPLLDPTIDRWFTKTYQSAYPERIAAIRTMVGANSPEGYASCCEALAAAGMKPRLSGIRCPVHVICGEHDPSTPPARGEEIVAEIPGATLAVLDAAHVSAIEAADAFAAELAGFMAKVG